MGLLSAMRAPALMGQGGQTPPYMPQMPPQGGGLQGAFSGNPQFQQQLQALMSGQGPGMSAPTFTPPAAPMANMSAPSASPSMFGGGGGGGLAAMQRLAAMRM